MDAFDCVGCGRIVVADEVDLIDAGWLGYRVESVGEGAMMICPMCQAHAEHELARRTERVPPEYD